MPNPEPAISMFYKKKKIRLIRPANDSLHLYGFEEPTVASVSSS